jgi:hypothetical protein
MPATKNEAAATLNGRWRNSPASPRPRSAGVPAARWCAASGATHRIRQRLWQRRRLRHSPDHAVSMDPFSADRIQVLRGPTRCTAAAWGRRHRAQRRIPAGAAGPFIGRVDLRAGRYRTSAPAPPTPVAANRRLARRRLQPRADDYDSAGAVLNSYLEAKGGSGDITVSHPRFLGASAASTPITATRPSRSPRMSPGRARPAGRSAGPRVPARPQGALRSQRLQARVLGAGEVGTSSSTTARRVASRRCTATSGRSPGPSACR